MNNKKTKKSNHSRYIVVGSQKGKKYNDDIKEIVFAEIAATGNMTDVCKKYNLPKSTVQSWKKKEIGKDDDVAQLRLERKKEFVNNAWDIIAKAQKVLHKELDAGVNGEEKLDIGKLSTVIGTMYDKQALANNEATEITKIKLEDFAE